jgi:release factor glutamine methyltransferase
LITIAEALTETEQAFGALPDTDPRLEAEVLLAHALKKPRSYLFAWPEQPLSTEQQQRFQELATRRRKGEPVAYLTGRREFWSLDLRVTPAVLIPRPETELLVEQALKRIPETGEYCIADLGTGSGAVAAAIAGERPQCRITATDLSSESLEVAESNFRSLKRNNIETAVGSWCEALPAEKRFDLIVSNPPYVAQDDPYLLQGDLPWEPQQALRSGPDGLDDIRRIIQQVPAHLTEGRWLLLEHGYQQGAAVRALLAEGGFSHINTYRDLAGHERISEGCFEKDSFGG